MPASLLAGLPPRVTMGTRLDGRHGRALKTVKGSCMSVVVASEPPLKPRIFLPPLCWSLHTRCCWLSCRPADWASGRDCKSCSTSCILPALQHPHLLHTTGCQPQACRQTNRVGPLLSNSKGCAHGQQALSGGVAGQNRRGDRREPRGA